MGKFESNVSLYLASIIAAYAILGLILVVPGLLAGASTLILVGIVFVVVVVILFAAGIILNGLSRFFSSFR